MRTSGSVPDRRRSPQQSPSNHQMMLLARRSDRTTFRKHRLTDTFNLDDKNFLLRNRLAYFHDSEFPLYMHSHDFYEIDHAVKLLRTTDHSVAFIAQSCGFSDSSHLIRTFKETVGMTPIQFKKANPRAGD